jgi:hypothetical protein
MAHHWIRSLEHFGSNVRPRVSAGVITTAGPIIAVVVAIGSVGCAGGSPPAPASISPSESTSSRVGSAAVDPPGSREPLVTRGAGWNAAGLSNPQPIHSRCHYRHSPYSHHVLPDLRCTPGSVTASSLADATAIDLICGRPSAPVAEFPPDSLVERYLPTLDDAYGIPERSRADYTYSWLIPAALGGSATLANLWPVPRDPKKWDPALARASAANRSVYGCEHATTGQGHEMLDSVQRSLQGDDQVP